MKSVSGQKELVLEYFEVHEPQPLPRRSGLVLWCPPQVGFFKANFDAAIFDSTGLAGIGVVVRDQSGHVIAALIQMIKMPHSVDLAEALACSRAVQFAQELSLFRWNSNVTACGLFRQSQPGS